MVCLNPITTETVIIITARPIATPAVAMRIAGRLTLVPVSLLLYIFLAMNKGRFTFLSILFYTLSSSLRRPG